jgi:predicted dehydrogenase
VSTKLSDEEKALGARNFNQARADMAAQAADRPDRRTFMKMAAAAGGIIPVSAAVYFGYEQWKGNKPVRTAIIGTGDEGGVLIGEHNKEYNQIVAVCDVRPYNLTRIFEGEPSGPRKGLNKIYGKAEAEKIKQYTSVDDLLKARAGKEVEFDAVIIATPLFTHKDIAVKCMDAGLHVLCEKLMARTIGQCKEMIAAAKKNGVLLNIGHQRHYSLLYAHAAELVHDGVLGEIKHIRALWHRNNSWPFDRDAALRTTGLKAVADPAKYRLPDLRDGWYPPIYKVDADALSDDKVKALGYKNLEELVRWRCFDRTGGGLMAELGSHQLDAASIFLGHVHPLRVSGVGGQYFYGNSKRADPKGPNPRESEDGVFVTFEFPGKDYDPTRPNEDNDVVIVTYSSFNTNGFEDYGECLMGSRGTLLVEKEANAYLFKEPEPGKAGSGGKETNVKVTTGKDGKPVMEAASTWGGAGGPAITKGASGPAWDTDIRGYRQEMEHFAFLVRRQQEAKLPGEELYKKEGGKYVHADALPRCHGEVAMADAIIALTANMAMDRGVRIPFEPAWFEADKPDVPETKWGKKA